MKKQQTSPNWPLLAICAIAIIVAVLILKPQHSPENLEAEDLTVPDPSSLTAVENGGD